MNEWDDSQLVDQTGWDDSQLVPADDPNALGPSHSPAVTAQRVKDFATMPSRARTGLADSFHGAAQIVNTVPGVERVTRAGANALDRALGGAGETSSMDEIIKAREAAYVPPEGFDAARMIGNIANPVTWVGPGKGSVLKQALAAAGLTAATTPTVATPESSFAEQKAKQAALGGTVGGAAGLAGRAATGAVPLSPEAQALVARGVEPSLGQAGGRLGWVIEGGAKALPLSSSVVGKSQRRGLDTYGVAAVNEAIAPLGTKVDGPTAREALTRAHEKVGNVYDSALSTVPAHSSAAVSTDFTDAVRGVAARPDVSNKAVQSVASEVQGYLNRVGEIERDYGGAVMNGKQLKELDSWMGQRARSYAKSPDPAHVELSQAWYDVQHAYRVAVLHPAVFSAVAQREISNGASHSVALAKGKEVTDSLSKANTAYRALLPISKALGVGETLHPHRLRTALETVPVERLAPMVDEGLGVLPRTAPQESPWGSTGGGMAAVVAAATDPTYLLTVPVAAAANSRVGTKVLTGQYPIQSNAYAAAMARALRKAAIGAARTPSERDKQR